MPSYALYEPQGVIHPKGQISDMPWHIRQFSVLDNDGNLLHFGENTTKIM